jgi:glycosyltransferase involved in cell wall biosynthesis
MSNTKKFDASKLSIVIPAFNEEKGITETLDSLVENFKGAEIIVVDDGSKDSTSDRMKLYSDIKIIQHRYNRGYGASIKTGMLSAEREFIAWFDADNEHSAEVLKAMVIRLDEGNLAAVLGERHKSVNIVRGTGKFFIRLLGRALQVKAGKDLNCGLRVFHRTVIIKYLDLLPDSYSASLTSTMILTVRNYPYEFFPFECNERIGQSKVAISDGFEALMLVLRVIMLLAPLRIFLRPSIFLLLTGITYSFWIALKVGEGFPVLGSLIILSGMVLGLLGLIADQISQMRINGLGGSPIK